MRPRVLVPEMLLALSAVSLAFAPAHAAWPHDPYAGNVLLSGASQNQLVPQCVSDGAGGAIVVWQDNRTTTSTDIYAQRVSASGVPMWTTDGVLVCNATGNQASPVLASDGAGGAIIAWQDYRSGSTSDVYVQRLDAGGSPLWAANGDPLCMATGQQEAIRIVSDGAGGAIVAWQDYRSNLNYDLYAQRVNALGGPQWTANGVALSAAAGDQYDLNLCSDGAGGAIAAWQDSRSGTNLDIYAQRVTSLGATAWNADGNGICTLTTQQVSAYVCTDGAGGAIVAWQDYRSGTNYDIYAQRVNPSGATLWNFNGSAVSVATNDQVPNGIAPDGAGGAILSWTDGRNGNEDIYAQRMTAGGGPLWTTDGVPVCTATGDQLGSVLVGDGAGGAMIVWNDQRYSLLYDQFAQRVLATGGTAWPGNGVAVSAAAGWQYAPCITNDASGGIIVAWEDSRVGGLYDIYAQRVDGYGQLGNVEPVSAGVRDVPNDQGGAVKVGWTASWTDTYPTLGIYDYRLWRSVPPNTATARAMLARGVTASSDEAAASGRWLSAPASANAYLWEYVASEPAAQLPGYSLVAATTSDSVAAGNPRTAFMIEARAGTYTGAPHWFSAPDSGYSADNLAPATPAPFTGNRVAGTTYLHWNPNTDADLAGYRLYRGATSGFPTGPGSLVAALSETDYADVAPAAEFYKLTAVDVHGNESPVALLSPSGTTDVAGGPARAFFALGSTNPVRGTVTLRFGLARAGHVTLALYDAAGRRVRTLVDDARDPGAFEAAWDGRMDSGASAGPGLYFARLNSPGLSGVRRLVLVQ